MTAWLELRSILSSRAERPQGRSRGTFERGALNRAKSERSEQRTICDASIV
jgi:hypothetical protein